MTHKKLSEYNCIELSSEPLAGGIWCDKKCTFYRDSTDCRLGEVMDCPQQETLHLIPADVALAHDERDALKDAVVEAARAIADIPGISEDHLSASVAIDKALDALDKEAGDETTPT